MLRARVLTALVLLAMVVPALAFLPVRGFGLFVLVFVAAAAWEWARLAGLAGAAAVTYGGVAMLTGAIVLMLEPGTRDFLRPFVYGVSALTWLAIAARWALRGPAAPGGARLAILGYLVLLPCWWAVMDARAEGALFMFLLMGLVWVADIAAYFAGRRFGRHKLAPSVSPGKTWEGVAGAMLGATLLALACLAWTTADGGVMDSWFAWLFAAVRRAGVAGAVAALAMVWALVGASILGDLFESLLKRHAGVKDSSGLLPGHGGVLDRIDALIPAMPLAMLVHFAVRGGGST